MLFLFYERVCFVVAFVSCWRCLIRTVCAPVIRQKCICALRVSLSCSLWFMEGCTAFQESVLSVWHSREAPCCSQGPQREKKRTWEFWTPTLKRLEHSIWGSLFSHAYLVRQCFNLAMTPKQGDYLMDRWFQVKIETPFIFSVILDSAQLDLQLPCPSQNVCICHGSQMHC